MNHFIVSVERRGNRRDTVEIPVSVETVIIRYDDEIVDCTTMAAASRGEWLAYENFGGRLDDWFAWKVEEDNE